MNIATTIATTTFDGRARLTIDMGEMTLAWSGPEHYTKDSPICDDCTEIGGHYHMVHVYGVVSVGVTLDLGPITDSPMLCTDCFKDADARARAWVQAKRPKARIEP